MWRKLCLAIRNKAHRRLGFKFVDFSLFLMACSLFFCLCEADQVRLRQKRQISAGKGEIKIPRSPRIFHIQATNATIVTGRLDGATTTLQIRDIGSGDLQVVRNADDVQIVGNLSPDRLYEVIARFVVGTRLSAPSAATIFRTKKASRNFQPGLPALSPPSSLSVRSPGGAYIELSWSSVQGADYYIVNIAPEHNSTNVQTYRANSSNDNSYIVDTGVKYIINIYTVINNVQSSTAASIPFIVPCAINAEVVITADMTSIEVEFITQVNAIQTYDVRLMRPGQDAIIDEVLIVVPQTTLVTFDNDVVLPDSTYEVHVIRICKASSAASQTSVRTGPIPTPNQAIITNVRTTEATVKTSPLTGSYTNLEITDVQVGTSRTIKSVNNVENVENLLPDTLYEVTSTYVVRGVSSLSSHPASFRTKAKVTTSIPTPGQVGIRNIRATQVTAVPTLLDGATTILRITTVETGTYQEFTNVGGALVVDNLSPDTQYEATSTYVVRGVSSSASTPASFRTAKLQTVPKPPSSPRSISLQRSSTGIVQVRWSPVQGVSLYKITVTSLNDPAFVTTHQSTVPQLTIDNLGSGDIYVVNVHSVRQGVPSLKTANARLELPCFVNAGLSINGNMESIEVNLVLTDSKKQTYKIQLVSADNESNVIENVQLDTSVQRKVTFQSRGVVPDRSYVIILQRKCRFIDSKLVRQSIRTGPIPVPDQATITNVRAIKAIVRTSPLTGSSTNLEITDVQAGTSRTIKSVNNVEIVENLLPDTLYEVTSTYVVRGVSSLSSPPASFRTAQLQTGVGPKPPSSPRSISLQRSSTGIVQVRWSPVQGVSLYKITVTSLNDPAFVTTHQSTVPQLTIDNLGSGDIYVVNVHSVRQGVLSLKTANARLELPCFVNAGLSIRGNLESIEVNLVLGDSKKQTYKIQLVSADDESNVIENVQLDTSVQRKVTFQSRGVVPDRSYIITLQRKCRFIDSKLVRQSVRTGPIPVPDQATITNVRETEATVRTSPLTGTSTNLEITDVQAGTSRTIKSVNNVENVENLLPDTLYEVTSTYVVRGVSSLSSPPASFRTKVKVTTSIPTPGQVGIRNIRATQVTAVPTLLDGATTILRITTVETGTYREFTNVGGALVVDNLSPDTQYEATSTYVVRGVSSSASTPASFRTAKLQTGPKPPSSPRSISLQRSSTGIVQVRWSPVQGVSLYKITVTSLNDPAFVTTHQSTVPQLTIDNLGSGDIYVVNVHSDRQGVLSLNSANARLELPCFVNAGLNIRGNLASIELNLVLRDSKKQTYKIQLVSADDESNVIENVQLDTSVQQKVTFQSRGVVPGRSYVITLQRKCRFEDSKLVRQSVRTASLPRPPFLQVFNIQTTSATMITPTLQSATTNIEIIDETTGTSQTFEGVENNHHVDNLSPGHSYTVTSTFVVRGVSSPPSGALRFSTPQF